MSELKPCPFCGGTPTGYRVDTEQGYKYGYVNCCCNGPEVRTSYDTSKDASWHQDAALEWNIRPIEDRYRTALEAIIERSNNHELGTGKVPDIRRIAEDALSD